MSMTVSEAMHKSVEALSPEASVSALAQSMKSHDIGIVPILDQEKLVGVVTDRDIVVRALANGLDPAKVKARDLMSRNVVSCSPDEPLKKAAKRMAKAQIRRLPVVNDGRLVGMLSMGDITQAIDDDDDCADLVRAVSDHHA